MLREIADAILSLLQSDPKLQSRVKAWFRGMPKTFENYPYIAVVWIGGEITYTGGIPEYLNDYEVIVVDLKPDPEDAEASVMELSEEIYTVLSGDPKLNDTVDDSKPVKWDSEGLPAREGYMKGARIVLRTRRFLGAT